MPTPDTAARPEIADPMRPAQYRVVANEPASKDSVTLTLEPLVERLPAGAPGQFTMMWAWGVGEVPISISALPGDGRYVHTVRDVGPVTRALSTSAPGKSIGLRGPFGVGWPMGTAVGHDVVVVAGGIGLAPMRPVIHRLLADRPRYGEVTVLIGARSAHDLLFLAEVNAWWRERRIRVLTIVDEPCSHWRGNVGIVTDELRRVDLAGPRTVAMLCGPEVMMRYVGMHLVEHGVPSDRIAVSLERNMQCGVGLCGHCQLAGRFVCTDGPVFGWDAAWPLLEVHEL